MSAPARALDFIPEEPDLDAVVLIVEGHADEQILQWLLEAAGFPKRRVRILIAQGKQGAAQMAKLAHWKPGRSAVLVDLDERSVPDAKARARDQLGNPPMEVFCAVPCTEAWLFADDRAALAASKGNERVRLALERSLPEDIEDPKQLALDAFGPSWTWSFLRQIDVGRAAARSSSLRAFLMGLGKLLDFPTDSLFEGVARSMNRDVISGLIREVTPADTILWRTVDGAELTAAELRRHIEEGDEIGRQYSSDLLRVSRDLLRRSANRSKK